MPKFTAFLVVLFSPLLLIAAEPFSQWRDVFSFDPVIYNFDLGNFAWTIGAPVLNVRQRPEDKVYAIKEPTAVKVKDRWHLFCVTRSQRSSHQIEYLSFSSWDQADKAQRQVLDLGEGDYSSPQVFFFTPQNKWYLILQKPDKAHPAEMLPWFSTSPDISKPGLWSKPQPMFESAPKGVWLWRDFWVICDSESAYLFGTGRDGRMWRCDTYLEDFPHKWSQPLDILKGDFMGAARVYKVGGVKDSRYLAIVEAMDVGRRYYKAYTAQYLDQGWSALTRESLPPPALRLAFAGPSNIRRSAGADSWTDSISHAEILREGSDELMEIDPHNWRLIFQGKGDEDRRGRGVGEVGWRIGMLEYAKPPAPFPFVGGWE